MFLLAVKQPIGTEAVWFIDRISVLALAVATVGAVVARASGDSARALQSIDTRARSSSPLYTRTRAHCALRARVYGTICTGSRSSCTIRAQ